MAGICTFPRLPCPCTKRHVMLNLSVEYRYLSTVCMQLASFINMVVDVVRNPQKSNEYEYEKKTCTLWLQDVLLLLSFLLWCSDDRRKNTRTRTP